MKLKLIVFSILLGIAFLACHKSTNIREVYTANAEFLIPEIVQSVKDYHFSPRAINDSLSHDIFTYFIEELDPKKEFFTQKDIQHLSVYEFALDEAITDNDFTFFNTAISLLENRIAKGKKYSRDLLQADQNFSIDENLETNLSNLDFAENEKTLKDRWRRKVKKYLLDQLYIEEKNNPSVDAEKRLTIAKETVQEILTVKFDELGNVSDSKRVNDYANAFLKVHDFQSHYLSPKEKSDWDDKFTRSFVGIGARLEMENGYPKVIKTIVGGPVWKANLLRANDVILKLNEKGESAIDLLGKSLDEIVALLKGESGTSVTLIVKGADALIREVEIRRDKIEFDLAMSFFLEDSLTREKIGYIRLPRFYGGNPGSAAHVLKEIGILKANNVKGIIFDVRNNQGGSVAECRDLISYFLNEGLYMQSKDSDGYVDQLFIDNPSLQFDGELLVLTNSRSGSASELFSGTLQDYKRAVIVGGSSTYGKGSRQNFVQLNDSAITETEFGEIKMTVGLFYTAAGRSPQSNGIVPDIGLPDDSKYVVLGERSKAFSLATDSLPLKELSQTVNVVENIGVLKANSNQRIIGDRRFLLADEKARRLLELEKSNVVELELDAYNEQRALQASMEKKWKEIFSEIKGFKVSFDKAVFAEDSSLIIQRERWIEKIETDPYIYECYQIINDMIG